MSTRVLLVRHGHVEGIDPPRFRGRRDLPLTPRGKTQAQAVARRIADSFQITAIYASPLARTTETAEAIARTTGLSVTRETGLIDIDYGRWHGMTVEDARRDSPNEIAVWLRSPDQALIQDGETLPDVLARATRTVVLRASRHDGQTIVLVSHDSVLRVILLHALAAPLASYWRIEQAPCSISELSYVEGRLHVARVNDTVHLERLTDG